MTKMLIKNFTLNKNDKEKGLKFPEKTVPDLAYLIGVLAGDGILGYRKKKNEYCLKCVGNPKDEIDFYRNTVKPKFEEIFGISLKLKYFDKHTTYGFRIYSKSLVLFLHDHFELPLSPKYDSLHIPEIIKNDDKLLCPFIRGLFDTDGSMVFKKRYQDKPYYPVISFSSKSQFFVKEVAITLKQMGFKIVETYNYKVLDSRIRIGHTVINRIELNGKKNLESWLKKIGFSSEKHLKKIKKYRSE